MDTCIVLWVLEGGGEGDEQATHAFLDRIQVERPASLVQNGASLKDAKVQEDKHAREHERRVFRNGSFRVGVSDEILLRYDGQLVRNGTRKVGSEDGVGHTEHVEHFFFDWQKLGGKKLGNSTSLSLLLQLPDHLHIGHLAQVTRVVIRTTAALGYAFANQRRVKLGLHAYHATHSNRRTGRTDHGQETQKLPIETRA